MTQPFGSLRRHLHLSSTPSSVHSLFHTALIGGLQLWRSKGMKALKHLLLESFALEVSTHSRTELTAATQHHAVVAMQAIALHSIHLQ